MGGKMRAKGFWDKRIRAEVAKSAKNIPGNTTEEKIEAIKIRQDKRDKLANVFEVTKAYCVANNKTELKTKKINKIYCQNWKENIKGQDEIADREIKRITKWAGQALCYKVGALTIKKIIEQKIKEGVDQKEANQFFLTHSDFPLQSLL